MNKSSAFEQILHGSVEMHRTQISNYTNFYDGARARALVCVCVCVKIRPCPVYGTLSAIKSLLVVI